MEQAREEEPQVSICVTREACISRLGTSSTCNTSLHNNATRYSLLSGVSEVSKTIRDALVFGKRYLNGGRKLKQRGAHLGP